MSFENALYTVVLWFQSDRSSDPVGGRFPVSQGQSDQILHERLDKVDQYRC